MNGAVVCAYSRSKDGSRQLTAHFRVREFACKDGTDPVFVSPDLVRVLEQVREHFGRPVIVNSGFRTEAWNRQTGGAAYSQHQYGMAADIRISGISPQAVADYAENLLPDSGGIGVYPGFTHIDVRAKKVRWHEK